MKLETQLSIGGTDYKLISHDIALKLSDAGQATFEVQADSDPAGVVLFDAGYTVGQWHRYFIGYVTNVTAKSEKHRVVYTRELCNALDIAVPISLRHCFMNDVLSELSNATALTVATDTAQAYSNKQVSKFFSSGNGFFALRSVPRVFGITDFVFWQRVDGSLWCGDWADSAYAKQGGLVLDAKLFTEQKPNSVKLPALPALRPGMIVNGQRLNFVRFSGHDMTLRWA